MRSGSTLRSVKLALWVSFHFLGLRCQGRLNNEPLPLFFNCVCVLDLNILVQANPIINKLKVIKCTVLEQMIRSAAWRSILWEAGARGMGGQHDAWRKAVLCLFREGCGFTGCCGLLWTSAGGITPCCAESSPPISESQALSGTGEIWQTCPQKVGVCWASNCLPPHWHDSCFCSVSTHLIS